MSISAAKCQEVYFKFYCSEGKLEVIGNWFSGGYIWGVRLNDAFMGNYSGHTNTITPTQAKVIAAEVLKRKSKTKATKKRSICPR